jgi:Uma2 family endonuclease
MTAGTRSTASTLLGPDDDGRMLTLEEWQCAAETPGFVYELIEGRVDVSPWPKPSHQQWVYLIQRELERYIAAHAQHANFVTPCEVAIESASSRPSRPQPDLGVFRNVRFPVRGRWEDLSPIVVVEVISERRGAKDTDRNRRLYGSVPSIREYWIVDPRGNEAQPALIALTRADAADDWAEQHVPFGSAFASTTLPGFTLNLQRALESAPQCDAENP